MTKRAFLILLLLASMDTPIAAAGPPARLAFLWQLYRSGDVFTLRERLPEERPSDPAEIQFLRAATRAAFADYRGSSAILRRLLRGGTLPVNLTFRARELLMLNERSQFRYREALPAIAPLLQSASADLTARPDVANRARLLDALKDVPPELVDRRARTVVLRTSGGLRTITVSIDGRALPLTFDTAANFSVLSRSAAHTAGIRIRPLGYEIRSSTGERVKADVAIGRLAFGSELRIDNAVFLVLPDASLRIPGRELAGLIGLPVMAQLGAIRFNRSAVALDADGGRFAASGTPLAMVAGVPILRVGFLRGTILCRIDSAANRTVTYENFYRRFSNALPVTGRREQATVASIGGPAALSIRRAPHISFVIGRRTIKLTNVPIISEPDGYDGIACSIGQDALRQLTSYTIDLKRMRLFVD